MPSVQGCQFRDFSRKSSHTFYGAALTKVLVGGLGSVTEPKGSILSRHGQLGFIFSHTDRVKGTCRLMVASCRRA